MGDAPAPKLGVVLAAKFGDGPAVKFGVVPAPKFGLDPFMPVIYEFAERPGWPGIDIGCELEICSGSVAFTVGA